MFFFKGDAFNSEFNYESLKDVTNGIDKVNSFLNFLVFLALGCFFKCFCPSFANFYLNTVVYSPLIYV
jgi:hypothetical protein